MLRNFGSIYTPSDIACFLVTWAIQSQTDTILDLGVGEGVFVHAAFNRLRDLGSYEIDAQNNIFGAEINKSTYKKFLKATKAINIHFPNVRQADFFDEVIRPVDVVVGNPPYVRRKHIAQIDNIRASVLQANGAIVEKDLKRLTDLYVYFLLRALPFLKPGGRLAAIVADPWLNVGYGHVLKKYLKQQFKIEQLISLDRRVFDDAQVKPVLLMATKTDQIDTDWQVTFTRVKNGLPIHALPVSGDNIAVELADLSSNHVPVNQLEVDKPWGVYFKASDVYELLASHLLMKPVAEIAHTQIGIQTLAKDFFTLTPEQAKLATIEPEFLEPLAQSAKYFNVPVLHDTTPIPYFLFFCDRNTEDLADTKALEYIRNGETKEVKVRGKNKTVTGYHDKERIKKANRPNWYDLKTAMNRRGRAAILIPRLIYRKYMVLWNKAQFIPGELFIEFVPREQNPELEVYLAVLTSTPTEIMLRMHAQVYGGGTYNINPGEIKKVPILDVTQLTNIQKNSLIHAYRQYLSDPEYDRSPIDDVIYEILGFDIDTRQKITEALQDLIIIATSAKQSAN